LCPKNSPKIIFHNLASTTFYKLKPFPKDSDSLRLIGRKTELSTLLRMLEDTQCRLVTITGMRGIGKTQLAFETASAARINSRIK